MTEKMFVVSKKQIVRAKNMGDARALVDGDKETLGSVLADDFSAKEISSDEASKYFSAVDEDSYIYSDYAQEVSEDEDDLMTTTFSSESTHGSTVDWLRNENKRLARQADKYKNIRDEAVKMVYQAAYDSFSGFNLPKIQKPILKKNKGTNETAVAVFADWQLGKVTSTYNSDVLAKRIEEYTKKMIEIVEIQRAHHNVNNLHVWLLGDIVEGEEIFPGQSHLLDAGLYRQVGVYGPEIISRFISTALEHFEHIHVTGVIGNHGAVGGKNRRQHDPETNMDRLLYKIVQLIFKDEPRVTFNIPDGRGERSFYAVDTIGEYSTLLIHGDQMPSPTAFHGYYKKVMGWKDGAIPEHFDDVFMGHYHQQVKVTIGSGLLRISGSPESNNTYAQEFFSSMSRPCQHLMFVHPERGVTSEYSIWLDEG